MRGVHGVITKENEILWYGMVVVVYGLHLHCWEK